MVKQRVYLDERMLLQFQQVQLELNSAPFFELDGTGNTLHLDLKEQDTVVIYLRIVFCICKNYRGRYSSSVFDILVTINTDCHTGIACFT